jgi:hypothetical protein
MENIEKIIADSIHIGCIQTLSKLGLIDEMVTEKQAWKMYGKRSVTEWRSKRWIVGYPTGNKSIRKFSYKRSELETASRMLSIQNIIPATLINQINQALLVKSK